MGFGGYVQRLEGSGVWQQDERHASRMQSKSRSFHTPRVSRLRENTNTSPSTTSRNHDIQEHVQRHRVVERPERTLMRRKRG